MQSHPRTRPRLLIWTAAVLGALFLLGAVASGWVLFSADRMLVWWVHGLFLGCVAGFVICLVLLIIKLFESSGDFH